MARACFDRMGTPSVSLNLESGVLRSSFLWHKRAMATAIAHLLPDLLQHHSDMGQDVLLAIASLSKEFRQIARKAWEEKKGNYKPGTQPGVSVQNLTSRPRSCAGCKRKTSLVFPFDQSLHACMTCTGSKGPRHLRIISKTECKQELLLNDADLLPCAVLCTRHRSYHNDIRMYMWQDVAGIAFQKHGGPEGLNCAIDERTMRRLRRGGTARAKRETLVEKIVAEYSLDKREDKDTIMDACCDQFLQNGKGGQREVRARIERYLQFDVAAPPATGRLQIKLDEYWGDYLASGADSAFQAALNASKLYEALNGCVDCLSAGEIAGCLAGRFAADEIADAARDRAAREKVLKAALAPRGLELKAYCRLCDEYMWSNEGDIDKVVDTLDEMRFYYAHTSYHLEFLYTSSQEAKNIALDKWVEQGGRPGSPELPLSLVRAVDKRVWKLKRATAE
jgi:hypothetical protein